MSIHDRIRQEREAATPEAERLKTYRRYARGRHRDTLNAQQRRVLRQLVGNIFCDNVVATILSELRNRLRLARFEVDGDDAASDPVLRYIRNVWTLNSVGEMANMVHWSLLRDGDHGVMLNYVDTPSGGRVSLSRELWWNGDVGLWVAYDDHGDPEYAVKEWEEGGDRYRTIYEPARIRRFRQNGQGWAPYDLESDPDAGPTGVVYWTVDGQPGGEPIGLPVVHFRNVQVPQDPEGGLEMDEPDPEYGTSEMDGGILGLQDEVNDVHRDITSSARYAGFPMLFGTGVEQPTNEDGEPTEYKPEPGSFFRSSNDKAEFGRIEAGSIETLKETLKVKLEAMSRASKVPMYTFTGQWPSGEALIRAEMPLIDKVETIGDSVGPSWGSVMHKATRLHNVFGPPSAPRLDEDLMISAVFTDPTRRDRATSAEVAKKVDGIVSRREQLRILGYSPAETDKIMDELAEERAQRREESDAFVDRVMERRQRIDGDDTGGDGDTSQ
jgi:hypothetical protein